VTIGLGIFLMKQIQLYYKITISVMTFALFTGISLPVLSLEGREMQNNLKTINDAVIPPLREAHLELKNASPNNKIMN